MNKTLKKLRERKGMGAFIELTVAMYVFVMLLVLFISYMSLYERSSTVNNIAHEMARYVEVKGIVDSGTTAEFNRLKTAAGLPQATMQIDTTGRIQLEEPFTITVKVGVTYGIGTIQVVRRDIRGTATGRSEVYWK